MKKEAELIKKMRELFGTSVQTFPAMVLSVDEAAKTIDVLDQEDNEVFNVRLKASIDDEQNGVVEIPVVASWVLVGIIGNDENSLFVLMCNDVEKLVGFIGDTTCSIDTDGIVIDGGANGGLTITPELVTNLDKTNALINALTTIISGVPIPEPGNGAPSALQAALATALTGQSLGDFSAIENERVKH